LLRKTLMQFLGNTSVSILSKYVALMFDGCSCGTNMHCVFPHFIYKHVCWTIRRKMVVSYCFCTYRLFIRNFILKRIETEPKLQGALRF
jgi:hypothetical protein